MRLQRLAKDPESYAVGGCQTMYLAENGMFTVQGLEVDTDTLGNVEKLRPARRCVHQARDRHRGTAPLPGATVMTVELIPPGDPEFLDRFHQFRYTVFRLETLQEYGNSGEAADFEAFLAGLPKPAQTLATISGRRWSVPTCKQVGSCSGSTW